MQRAILCWANTLRTSCVPVRSAADIYAARASIALQTFQICAHLRCALVTQVAILLHALVDYLREFGWNSGVESNGIDWVFVQDFVENRARGVALKRKKAGG